MTANAVRRGRFQMENDNGCVGRFYGRIELGTSRRNYGYIRVLYDTHCNSVLIHSKAYDRRTRNYGNQRVI